MDDGDTLRGAEIIGVRFEGETEDGERFGFCTRDFFDEALNLALVGGIDGFEQG